jgi:hypothetical protein
MSIAIARRVAVFVFEIVVPGTWLDYLDRDWAWEVEGQLRHLRSQFFEANNALNLFTHVRSIPRSFADQDAFRRASQRRLEIRRIVEQELGRGNWDAVDFEVEVRYKREQWANGRIPREFEHTTPFLYARAFLYALDAFDKFLKVLSKTAGVPPVVVEASEKVGLAFPHLRGVRNTAQHLEDRAQSLGANGKPLNLKPIDNSMVKAPAGGVLMLGCLNDSKYGSTMSDGHYGEVDVSPESMDMLREILQAVLDSFSWKGSRQHEPSA